MNIYGVTLPIQLVNTMRALLVAVTFDAALGVVLAVRQGTFDWEKLPQFLRTNLLPYVLAILAAALAAFAAGGEEIPQVFYGLGALVLPAFIKSIKDKLTRIFQPGNGGGQAPPPAGG